MPPPPSRPNNWRVAYACLALRIAGTLTYSLSDTPFQRILEENVCRNHYRISDPSVILPNDSVPEDLCKIADIQSEISHIQGLFAGFITIPFVLAALPYLFSQDRLANKRRTLLFNVLGSTMMYLFQTVVLYFYNVFSPRWVWALGVFAFIGGGDLVLWGIVQSLIAESINPNILSTFYIYTSATTLVVKTLGAASALVIMGWSLWLPVVLSMGCGILILPIVYFFMPTNTDRPGYSKEHSIPLASLDEAEDPDEGLIAQGMSKKPKTLWTSIAQQRDILLKYRLPLSMFGCQEIGNSLRVILPYWFSKRYHWTLRDNGWVQLGITILTAIIVASVPRLGKHMQKKNPGLTSRDRDLSLARTCLGFSTIGVSLLGFSWYRVSGVVSLVVMAGGTAFRDTYTSYITVNMEREEIARMFVVMEMVSLICFSIGGWIVGEAYSISLKIGENTWATSIPVWSCVLPFVVCWYYLR